MLRGVLPHPRRLAEGTLTPGAGGEPFDWGKIDVIVDGAPVASGLNCHRDQASWKTPALLLCKGKPGRHRVEVVALHDKDDASSGYGCQLAGLLVSGSAAE